MLEAPQRIRWVCIDLLKHYKEHIQPNGFKAMIVTSSRRAAVLYKETLDELEAPPSECIISGSHNYLTEALEMFSTEDVAGALKDLKDEIPKLKAAHTRVMRHFKDMDKQDIDAS